MKRVHYTLFYFISVIILCSCVAKKIEKETFENAKNSDSFKEYQEYVNSYPDGIYHQEATSWLNMHNKLKNIADSLKKDDDGETFLIVKDTPSFYGGGIDEFKAYIHLNLQNKKPVIQGEVKVSFVVDETGKVTEIKVNGPNESLNQEVLKVVNSSPNWMPGLQKGKPVRVMHNFQLNFN